MSLFENFPYANLHNLNLDWIIGKILEFEKKLDTTLFSKIVIADPIQWDITKQYEQYTIVMDNGNAYLSMQAVPYGINISNTDYWEKIFDLNELFDSLKQAISFNDDGDSVATSVNRSAGSLVWRNNVLYLVTEDMTLGDFYTDDNTEEFSIEQALSEIRDILTTINNTITDLQNKKLANRLYGKQIAIYGDSYSASPRGVLWQTVLNALTGTTCHVNAAGSLSLPMIYNQKWDYYEADIYLIQCGLNDCSLNVTGNSFMYYIEAFVDAIRTVNANAEIYFVSPPAIPSATIHNYVLPIEFYRQCMWKLSNKYKYGVIDGLKWVGLKYSDGVHPTDATCPLIGSYVFTSLLNYGDSPNNTGDYSKCGRNDTKILFIMQNGECYVNLQNPVFENIAFDGSAAIDINALGLGVLQARVPYVYKSGTTYVNAFLMVYGEGSEASPLQVLGAFEGYTSGSITLAAGIYINVIPTRWFAN